MPPQKVKIIYLYVIHDRFLLISVCYNAIEKSWIFKEKEMKTAGGYIALFAGILGSVLTSTAYSYHYISFSNLDYFTVERQTLTNIIFTLITFVLACFALGFRKRLPGILLILNSIAGAIICRTSFVPYIMVVSLLGGILIIIGDRKMRISSDNSLIN